ncbi:MAG: fatty acid desaturase [Gammaproteobacteria bacterium]|nr:fatty acid desaturase [Gammaproteobacteria bacterium]
MLIDKRTALREIAPYAKPSNAIGLTLFLIDYTVYWTAIVGVLFLPDLWMKFLAATVAGFKMGGLKTLGHDAAHGALVANRKLNWLLGVLVYMPCLYNYRMWVYDHHIGHHPRTNGPHKDTYTPFTKAEYDAMPAWRRAMERLYRSPALIGLSFYYLIERWWDMKVFPRAHMPERYRRAAWPHFAFLMCFATVYIGTLIAAPAYTNLTSVQAVLLGFVWPFLVFMWNTGFALYLQHTHPRILWLRGADEDNAPYYDRSELMSVHWVFPGWFGTMIHDVMDHPVHHLHPRVPVYKLRAAQAHLNELLGEYAIVEKFTWSTLFDTMRRCKLYDFENHRWLDFDGNPTTESAPLIGELQTRELMASSRHAPLLLPDAQVPEAA